MNGNSHRDGIQQRAVAGGDSVVDGAEADTDPTEGLPAMRMTMEDDEQLLLHQLQELHGQLAEIRNTRRRNQPSGTRVVENRKKIIVAAALKPVVVRRADDGDIWAYEESKGGFKSAIDSVAGSNRVQWVGWPGSHVDPSSRGAVRKRLETEYFCTPVFISPEVEELYYQQFCKSVLWPLFHCIPTFFNKGLLENFSAHWEAYSHANKLFLEAVAEVYEPGDLVLVYNYELMLLPALLRKRFPELVCGFFLHCPFPSTEFYRMLPVRQSLLRGILGADLVSFNHFDYVRHFLNSCTRILGLESYPSKIEYNGRPVSVSICPMGINPDGFEVTADVQRYMDRLRKTYKSDVKMIVSIDRLDLCKGTPLKLLAMESLLENFKEWQGKVVMFSVLRDDGRRGDSELRRAVDRLVGRVNGRFGQADYSPVYYVKKTLTRREQVALYALADVALVTSLRDGIDLTAMEFIACQQETRRGVLVYSEFAGCASSFKGAMLVNPYDPDRVAESINTALTMPARTKAIRHHQLSRYVNEYTSSLWARRIVSSLQHAGQKAHQHTSLEKLDPGYLSSFYGRSRRRLLCLDYDGTLVQQQYLPELAAPTPAALAVLEALCADPSNVVYVVSGRRRQELNRWLGHIDRLGLAAEYGYWVRTPRPWRRRHGAPASEACDEESLAGLAWGGSAYGSVSGSIGGPSGGLPPALATTPDRPEVFWSSGSGVGGGGAGGGGSSLRGRTIEGFEARSRPAANGEAASSASVATAAAAGGRRARSGSVGSVGSGLRTPLQQPNLFHTASWLSAGTGIGGMSPGGAPAGVGRDGDAVVGGGEVAQRWRCRCPNTDLSWMDDVLAILRSYTDRTPGSYLEVKESGLTWHYRSADPEFGLAQAKNLQLHFDQMLQNHMVRVVMSPVKGYIVVQPARVRKGKAVSALKQDHERLREFDFILGMGDERTDEDMFDVLKTSLCFTVTVGKKDSKASHYVDDVDAVIHALQVLAHTSQQCMARDREAANGGHGHKHHASMSSLKGASLAATLGPPPPPGAAPRLDEKGGYEP